jgi:Nucleotidyl transferase AbiEii toxin, Type IV TA system
VNSGVSEFHAQVAAIALRAAGHGFMLAGGNALLAYGVSARPTMDVNLITSTDGGVRPVREAVENALKAAGFHVERIDPYIGGDDEPGWVGETAASWAEWTVARAGKQVSLQVMVSESLRDPVIMGLGPVMAVEDVLGSKLRALVDRADARDYIDIGAALKRYSPDQLMAWAREQEPNLTDDDFAFVPFRLAELEDETFAPYRLNADAVAQLRDLFAAWHGRGSGS